MIEIIKEHIKEVENYNVESIENSESFRIKYLGKKGILNELFKKFKDIDVNERKIIGKEINILKSKVKKKILEFQSEKKEEENKVNEDLYKPGFPFEFGSEHPLNIVRKKIIEIFEKVGYCISEGPEIEDDWHNFTALNLPKHHPARDMQDTFFINREPDILLRTHTSSVQIRYMEQNPPPIKTISPGRVYRNEDVSARSNCLFHQVEGLYIDKDISFANLKHTIEYFCKSMFGKSQIRLRPSYFPFTEPSAEVDIYWGLKSETDYRITKGTGWLEIMGCGMVDPNVLNNCNIDPEKYSGFAFGMGIERIAMLIYQISDIRYFFQNDLRFLKQFSKIN